MKTIALSLPWPPTTNNLYANKRRGGGRVLKAEGRNYKASVLAAVVEAGYPTIEGRLAVWLQLFPPNNLRRDIANSEKIVIDGLVDAKVFADDSQIDHLTIERCEVVPDGEVRAFIAPASMAPPIPGDIDAGYRPARVDA